MENSNTCNSKKKVVSSGSKYISSHLVAISFWNNTMLRKLGSIDFEGQLQYKQI